MKKIEIEGLNCLIELKTESPRIAYLLYPMDILRPWIELAASHYNTSIVVIMGMDWDNDLTPWAAPGQPPGSPDFRGDASSFLVKLSWLMAALENQNFKQRQPERTLIGVSLSGLFTLWQWIEGDYVQNIGCLSGSFWYEGFEQWVSSRKISKEGRAYFLLGNREAETPIRAFRSVAVDTQRIVEHLKEQGINCEYEIVPGNHYQYPIERLNRAMDALFS